MAQRHHEVPWLVLYGHFVGLVDYTKSKYIRFKGKDGQHGETKLAVAHKVAVMIEAAGVVVEHTPKAVYDKISELVKSFRGAHAVRNRMGQEANPDKGYAIYKHYNNLLLILGDRPIMAPLCTNKFWSPVVSLEPVTFFVSPLESIQASKEVAVTLRTWEALPATSKAITSQKPPKVPTLRVKKRMRLAQKVN